MGMFGHDLGWRSALPFGSSTLLRTAERNTRVPRSGGRSVGTHRAQQTPVRLVMPSLLCDRGDGASCRRPRPLAPAGSGPASNRLPVSLRIGHGNRRLGSSRRCCTVVTATSLTARRQRRLHGCGLPRACCVYSHPRSTPERLLRGRQEEDPTHHVGRAQVSHCRRPPTETGRPRLSQRAHLRQARRTTTHHHPRTRAGTDRC